MVVRVGQVRDKCMRNLTENSIPHIIRNDLVALPGKPTGRTEQQQWHINSVKPFRNGRVIENVTPVGYDARLYNTSAQDGRFASQVVCEVGSSVVVNSVWINSGSFVKLNVLVEAFPGLTDFLC
jgi:hypothetical protein